MVDDFYKEWTKWLSREHLAALNFSLITDCGHTMLTNLLTELPLLIFYFFFISLSEIPKCNPCLTSIPLAMTCDLLAGQKQRFWRVSSACRRCGAKSASSSSAPVSLRILCWPSSVNERLASSLSHRPRRLQPLLTDVALIPAALGTGTDKKAWRKLFWESQKWNKSEQRLKFQS